MAGSCLSDSVNKIILLFRVRDPRAEISRWGNHIPFTVTVANVFCIQIRWLYNDISVQSSLTSIVPAAYYTVRSTLAATALGLSTSTATLPRARTHCTPRHHERFIAHNTQPSCLIARVCLDVAQHPPKNNIYIF